MTPELSALECNLWNADTRFDRAFLDATFAEESSEFGRSGWRYDLGEMVLDDARRQVIDATLHGFAVRPLSGDLVLATYVSEVRGIKTEWANRSSIWDRSTGRWRLRCHQGTPTEPLR